MEVIQLSSFNSFCSLYKIAENNEGTISLVSLFTLDNWIIERFLLSKRESVMLFESFLNILLKSFFLAAILGNKGLIYSKLIPLSLCNATCIINSNSNLSIQFSGIIKSMFRI